MTISVQYGLSPIKNTGLKTYTRIEDGIAVNLVRIKKIISNKKETKIYIEPLGLTDVKTVNEAKTILSQKKFATLQQVRGRDHTFTFLQACASLHDEITPDFPSTPISPSTPIKYEERDVYVLYDNSGSEEKVAKLSGTKYFTETQYQQTEKFFKMWYTQAVKTIKANRK